MPKQMTLQTGKGAWQTRGLCPQHLEDVVASVRHLSRHVSTERGEMCVSLGVENILVLRATLLEATF